jgi:PAS domain S-box-containing protein
MIEKQSVLPRYGTAIIGALALPLIYFVSRQNYNLFHSLADGVSIVIAACAFAIVWNSRRLVDNNYYLYTGVAFLFFAFLDLMHLLGNKDMGVFPGYGNLGPTFYIASRYFLSISLLIAPFFINRKLNTTLMSAAYSLVVSLVLLSVFYWRIFPACIVEGVGLTPFKVVSDYIICLILLGAIGLLLVNRRFFDWRVLRIILSSLILFIATGLTFTLYTDPFGVTNMVGHLFQIASFYLVYLAFVETSLTKPHETLFRKLKQNEEKLTENVARLDQANVVLNKEVAERKRAETELRELTKSLRESEQRWATTLASIGDAVIATDGEGRITFMNAVAEDLTGWRLSEASAKPVTDVFRIINESTRKEVESPVGKVLHQGMIAGLANHTILIRKDGREVSVDDSGAPIRDGEGKTVGVVLVFRDITDRRRAEDALQKAYDEMEGRVEERTVELKQAYEQLKGETREREQVEERLRQSQKMEAIGTLAGGIAHDFNNLLGAIIGFTELIQDDLPVGSPGHRHAARVMEAGLRGRDLVKQMLTFSRKTGQEEKLLLQLSSIVKESAKLLRASIPTTIGINVSVASESGLILADPVRIQQVVMNLCTNAYHAMREKGGTLDIELSEFSVGQGNENAHGIGPGLYMRLLVRDTGPGIPEEIKERIFDPFFTTKAVGEGTGLGLSVVMGIVKQSNGYITVESEPGKGSTFAVYFPKVTGRSAADAADREETVPIGSERILFVDDEEALRDMGEGLLTRLGYEVTCQGSSTAALALVEQDPLRFDLVITDQTMPDMTGIELAKRILNVRSDMPVILCTGFSHLVDADIARAAGIQGFAVKPLTKREIAMIVRKVLDEEDLPHP